MVDRQSIRRVGLFALLAAILVCAGCTITIGARLYDLDSGDVLQASVDTHGTGHGEIRVYAKDGTILVGEYSLVRQGLFSSSTTSVSGEVGGQYGWARAQGFTVTGSMAKVGSGVVAGNGTVLEVVFEVDGLTAHGYGVGRDNKGHKYRLEF
jgi:hypothetical protein